MITKILVANRAEIAQRVIRTAKEMGISTVVGYADADLESGFTAMADEAHALGGAGYADTYMSGEKLVDLAVRTGADAVHPGYGFLSESPEFASAVAAAGLTWIGPAPEVLTRLGDKIQARRLAESVDVQPVPGISEPVNSREEVEEFVARWGYPVVTKKSDGGGGRGITIIDSDTDLDHFFAAHGSHSTDFFVEKFVRTARHVETQCERDSHGNFAVVSTRDCSVQRRNQKLIEEAPAPALGDAEATMIDWSHRLFDAVGYVGLGTCEFLLDSDGSVYFLEVNPRLQVEHTVSEEVTGIDLVREQIRIASGEALTPVPAPTGHSFEFRITCEDPADALRPSSGTISTLNWPLGHGIRIESGVVSGDVVTSDFDSMLAKIIVTGPDRPTAIARSIRALDEFELAGVATPTELFRDVIASDVFRNVEHSTRWFEEGFWPEWVEANASASPANAGQAAAQAGTQAAQPASTEREKVVIEIDGRRAELTVPKGLFAGPAAAAAPSPSVPTRPQPLRHASRARAEQQKDETSDGNVKSQIQAIVVRVCVGEGQRVTQGDLLVVLESMKMESYVHAPCDGVVAEISVSDGQNVTPGAALVRLDMEAAPDDAAENTEKEG